MGSLSLPSSAARVSDGRRRGVTDHDGSIYGVRTAVPASPELWRLPRCQPQQAYRAAVADTVHEHPTPRHPPAYITRQRQKATAAGQTERIAALEFEHTVPGGTGVAGVMTALFFIHLTAL